MNGRNVGIREVAAAAGVSVTTVSHVLNEVASARISQETRDRVRSAAGQLGYGPNSAARALRTRRTALLGLVIEDLGANPHAAQTILGADDAARARGYSLLVTNISGAAAGPAAADAWSSLAGRVDGVLYAPVRTRPDLPLKPGSVPTVLVGAAGDSTPAVVADDDGGARPAVDCLRAAGHTRIGVVNSSGDHASDYAASRQVLGGANRPTGLVCHGEVAALGVYLAASELGLAIPADLSVVAVTGNHSLAASLHPPLTTVALPHYAMAFRATEILVEAIGDTPAGALRPRSTEVLACTVTARGSVAPPG